MELLIQAIKAGQARRWLVIVPRGIALLRLRRELADSLGSVFGLRITTLRGLLEDLALRLPLPRTISQLAAEEALGQIASTLPESTFSDLLRKPSAQRAALNTIRELKTAGVQQTNLAESGLDKLRSIAALRTAYDDFCARHGLIDPADRDSAVIAAAEAGNIALDGIENLLVTGFVALPHHHQRLLKALSRQCRIHLRLPSDGGRTGLFAENDDLLRRAEEWSAPKGKPPTALPLNPSRGEGVIGRLQRRLFAPLTETLPHDPARITIAAAPRRYDEVEAVGCRIAELLAKGIPPDRIGVTMRNLPNYDLFIRDVFDRLRIPFFYRRGIPILQAPPVRLAMKLTELAAPRVRYHELLALLRSPYIALHHADNLAALIIDSKLFDEKPEHWASGLASALGSAGSATPDKNALAGLQSLLADCLSIQRGKSGLAHFKQIVSRYVRLLPDDGSELSDRDRRGWERFLEVLDETIRLTGELEPLGITPAVDPLERLRERLREESIPAHRIPADSVYVLNFFDMGYVGVDFLFILGMDDGSVPGPVHLSNSLLAEADIRLLRQRNAPGAALLRDSPELRRSEEQAFLLTVSAAAKKIELTYPLLDSDGRETTPSPYLGEIQAILGIQDQEPRRLPGGDIRSIEQVPPYPLALRRQIARRLFRADLPEHDPLALPAYNHLLAIQQEREFLRRFLEIYTIEDRRSNALFNSPQGRRALANRFCGKIENDELRRWVADRFAPAYLWSVRSLEKMGVCPFDFFLSYCLGLREFHLPEEEPPPLDEGSLLHAVAREFVQRSRYPLDDEKSASDLMASLIESHFNRVFPARDYELPLPVRVMRLRMEAMMRLFVEFEAEIRDRTPIETEYTFGTPQDPLRLQLPGGEMLLRGRFDRIDRCAGGDLSYHVIDYKRGGVITSFPPSLKGHNLQMPLYIVAASHLYQVPPDAVRGGFYSFRYGQMKDIEPAASSRFSDWAYFLGIAPEPNHGCNAYDEDTQPKRLTELIEELIAQARLGYFPVEGRNGAKVPDLANLVGRWLEVPPEFESESGE